MTRVTNLVHCVVREGYWRRFAWLRTHRRPRAGVVVVEGGEHFYLNLWFNKSEIASDPFSVPTSWSPRQAFAAPFSLSRPLPFLVYHSSVASGACRVLYPHRLFECTESKGGKLPPLAKEGTKKGWAEVWLRRLREESRKGGSLVNPLAMTGGRSSNAGKVHAAAATGPDNDSSSHDSQVIGYWAAAGEQPLPHVYAIVVRDACVHQQQVHKYRLQPLSTKQNASIRWDWLLRLSPLPFDQKFVSNVSLCTTREKGVRAQRPNHRRSATTHVDLSVVLAN